MYLLFLSLLEYTVNMMAIIKQNIMESPTNSAIKDPASTSILYLLSLALPQAAAPSLGYTGQEESTV